MKIKRVLVVILFMVGGIANIDAAPTHDNPGPNHDWNHNIRININSEYSGYANVTEMGVIAPTRFRDSSKTGVKLTNNHNCSGSDIYMYYTSDSGDEVRLIRDLLLSAFSLGMQVNVGYICKGRYPSIISVIVRK